MATCVYCLLFIAVGSRRDQRDRDVVVVVGSGESRRARAGKEASVSDAICDSRARRDAREPREEKKAFRARKKERLSATSDAIEPGAGGGRTSLPPWPSYTPKKAVSSSRPRTVACASCGRRPVVGSVSAGERGRGREILRRPRETFPAPDGCRRGKLPKFRRSRRSGGGATRDAIDTAGDRYRRARVPPYSCATPASP